ncbi:MAG: TIGR03032 family protein [Alphaproteobacteria bacterium]
MSNTPAPAFALTASRGFTDWLAAAGGALAFTTYQAGKLFLLGLKPDGSLSVFERSFPRAMGLGVSADGRMLMLATQVQLFRFDNILPPGEVQVIHDAVYAPHATWITGDLDIHDVGIGAGDRPVFANTLFNCVATVADGHSFRPLWQPPFISRLAAEDRCHLNGLAMEGVEPRYVTCVSRSDISDGWRDRRSAGGIVVDVRTGAVVAEGLSMPHSPRLHHGRLWLLNSGTGQFGWVDPQRRHFTPLTFCPGYARGLAFAGGFAIVGLSRARENRTFQGLALDEALRRHDADARCGLVVIDLDTGDITDWIRIEGVIDEIFDVAVLPSVRCPALIGIKTPEIHRVISIAEG